MYSDGLQMKRDIRLLIVDDNVATRYALCRRLEGTTIA